MYEGSNYRDGTSAIDVVDNAVAPGKVFKYVWQVPERAGPTQDDNDCVTWAYYSDSASVRDFYTGLVGPLVVCRKVYCIYLYILKIDDGSANVKKSLLKLLKLVFLLSD